jgi:hypothetical protein
MYSVSKYSSNPNHLKSFQRMLTTLLGHSLVPNFGVILLQRNNLTIRINFIRTTPTTPSLTIDIPSPPLLLPFPRAGNLSEARNTTRSPHSFPGTIQNFVSSPATLDVHRSQVGKVGSSIALVYTSPGK